MNKSITAALLFVLVSVFPVVGGADFQAGENAHKSGDYATALKEFKPLAEQGDADAQNGLGQMHANGKGVLKKEAIKWYRLAAAQGNADAQFNLGVMYQGGSGVPKNDKEAIKWYHLAAEQGDTLAASTAQAMLKTMYVLGEATPIDDKESLRWYLKAAEQGDADAQQALARSYAEGAGAPQDYKEAMGGFRKTTIELF